MFVPLFPFPVPIPLIGEQLLPPNRPALPCTACTAHRACSSFLLDKGKAIGSPLCRAAPEDAANSVPPPPIPLGQKPGDQRGRGPLRRRSRNQEVPGVSLPTFSTRESRPGRGAERPPHGECRGATAPRIQKKAPPCVKGESHPCRPCTSAAAPGCGPNRHR